MELYDCVFLFKHLMLNLLNKEKICFIALLLPRKKSTLNPKKH